MLPLAFISASMSYNKYIEAFYFSKFYFGKYFKTKGYQQLNNINKSFNIKKYMKNKMNKNFYTPYNMV